MENYIDCLGPDLMGHRLSVVLGILGLVGYDISFLQGCWINLLDQYQIAGIKVCFRH